MVAWYSVLGLVVVAISNVLVSHGACALAARTSSVKLSVAFLACLLLNSLFQFHVGLLLDSLRVLQFLDQLHLEEFHLHDLLFLGRNNALLFFDLALDLNPGLHNFTTLRLFHLLFSDLLLDLHRCLSILILLGNVLHVLLMTHLVF